MKAPSGWIRSVVDKALSKSSCEHLEMSVDTYLQLCKMFHGVRPINLWEKRCFSVAGVPIRFNDRLKYWEVI